MLFLISASSRLFLEHIHFLYSPPQVTGELFCLAQSKCHFLIPTVNLEL